MEPGIAYKGFNPINYVIAIRYGRNMTLVDPLSFMLGRWRTETQKDKRVILANWLATDPKQEDYTRVFERRAVGVEVKEGKRHQGRRRIPHNLNLNDLVHNMKRWAEMQHKSMNIYTIGGERAFQTDTRFAGPVWLSANVRRLSNADGKHVRITIAAPYEDRTYPIGAIHSADTSFIRMAEKHGFHHASYISPEVAAALYNASMHPERFTNLEGLLAERNTDVWLPINPRDPQMHIHSFPILSKSEQETLDNLMVDSLIAYYTGANKYKVNRALSRLPGLYSPKLIRMIEEGRAEFIPVQERWIFHTTKKHPLSPKQKTWHDRMRDLLIEKHYHLNGLAVEKPGTDYEVTAIEYMHKEGKNLVRLLFYDNMPPLVMVRKTDGRFKPKVFESEYKPPKNLHPVAELYHPTKHFDDRTRKYTYSEITLTLPGAWTEESMIPDYAAIIQKHYTGGIKALRAWVNGKRKIFGDTHRVNKALVNTIAKYKP